MWQKRRWQYRCAVGRTGWDAEESGWSCIKCQILSPCLLPSCREGSHCGGVLHQRPCSPRPGGLCASLAPEATIFPLGQAKLMDNVSHASSNIQNAYFTMWTKEKWNQMPYTLFQTHKRHSRPQGANGNPKLRTVAYAMAQSCFTHHPQRFLNPEYFRNNFYP